MVSPKPLKLPQLASNHRSSINHGENQPFMDDLQPEDAWHGADKISVWDFLPNLIQQGASACPHKIIELE